MIEQFRAKRKKVLLRQQSRRVIVAKSLTVLTILIGLTVIMVRVYAEQFGSSPESGATSYTKSLYTTLQTAGYGSDTNTPDWGTYWNRISTAAQFAPSGNAATSDVVYGKTFFGSNRTLQAGAYGGTATVADVLLGKTFYNNTSTQQTGTYTPPTPGNCSTQAYHDSYGAPVTQTTNCTASITWTTTSPSYTGDDKKDPISTLIWSQPLLNSAGTVTFTTGAPSAWSWDASAANNNAVGTKTASQLCSDRGNGWRLPTQKELMQAYIDGSNFNLTQPARYYWSANQYDSTDAWYVALGNGYTLNVSMVSTDSVRCVR
ncbi:MAG: DUF1566 domain-containing protein [Candidatus Saccharimonadaceae bacterium]